MSKTLMVGISTGQNTVNVVPALQLEADAYLFLESDHAQKEQWTEKPSEVLKARGLEIFPSISLGNESNEELRKAQQQLEDRIPEGYQVLWNTTGGKKSHVMPLWELFMRRGHLGDRLVYMDYGSKKLEVQYMEHGLVKDDTELSQPIRSDLTVDEVLKIYRKTQQSTNELVQLPNLMEHRFFRRICFWLPTASQRTMDLEQQMSVAEMMDILSSRELKNQLMEGFPENRVLGIARSLNKTLDSLYSKKTVDQKKLRTELLKSLHLAATKYNTYVFGGSKQYPQITKAINELNDSSFYLENEDEVSILKENGFEVKEDHSVTTDFFQHQPVKEGKFSYYYEGILNQYLHELCENTAGIVDIKIHPNVYDEDGNHIAEYELLVATRYGNLVAFDAKTFDLENKDRDARLFNLANTGGQFATYVVVVPLHRDDAAEDFIPKQMKDLVASVDAAKIPNLKLYSFCHPEEEAEYATNFGTEEKEEVSVKHLVNFPQDFGLE